MFMLKKVTRGKYTPINPVALGTTHRAPNFSTHEAPILSTTVGDNAALMTSVAALWIAEGDVVVDANWGKGVFWKNLPGMPTHRHDIAQDGVDCRNLPYEDGTIDVVVLDPPYRATHGSKDFKAPLAGCYGLGTENLETINDVLALYEGALKEAARVVKRGGRVLVKCQDLSYNHRLHLVTLDVMRLMVESGFEFADQFILANATRLTSSVWKTQERARRAHSVMWVGVRV